jgi:thioredoxin reductase
MHGFLTRDGVSPERFREYAHRQLLPYKSVTFRPAEVTSARRLRNGCFSVTLGARDQMQCRKLLIATGVFDHVPSIEGVESFFGKSAFPCPYCEGWEIRSGQVAVYGKGQRGFEMARALTAWSQDILLSTGSR